MRRTSLLLLFAFLTFPLFGDASFTVTVPNRVGGPELMPIGRIKMTLELAPGAIGSLSVQEGANPAVVLNLDPGFQPLNNPNPSVPGSFDFVRYSQVGANVLIEILLRHVMDDPGNFCVLENNPAPPANWTYTLNFTGPAINGYRLSSYGAAGLVANSNPTACGLTRRRIFSTPAFTSLAATNRGRHPQDIVLVLDNSGSMDWDTPGSPGEKRMDVLDASASMFLSLWETEGFDPTLATGGTGLSDDRLGLIWFSTNLTIPFPGGIPNTTAMTVRGPSASPGPMHPWNPILNSINTMAPTNATAIGKGLQAGLDSVAASANDAAIVLLTDGLQNVAPMVERVGNDPNATVQISGIDLASHGVPILTVSLGIPGGVDPALFDDVARKTAGRSRLTATSIGSASSFAGQLVSALLGDTLLVATEGSDSLPGGASADTPILVPLDGSIKRVAFALSWSTRFPNALDLQITPPGAAEPIVPVTQHRGASWLVYGADIPSSGTAGDWQVRVVRRNTEFTAVQLPEVPYYLGIYTYEGKLDFEGALPSESTRTGDPVTVRTELAFDRQPVTNAEGRIKLRIARPGESIGNLLHDLSVDPAVLGTELPGSDTTNRYQRKLNELGPTILPRVEPALLPGEIVLLHEGNGLYSATFTDTSEAGQYKFLLTYDFDAPDGSGRIRRIEQLERDVKVKADPAATIIDAEQIDGGLWSVIVTPKDRFGNYLGPGYPSRVKVVLNGPGTISAIQDVNETGDYRVTINGVPPGLSPDVTVTVDGVTIPTPGLTGMPLGPTLASSWRFFLDFGVNDPDSTILDGEWSLNGGIERMFSNNWSAEAIGGWHTFDHPLFDADVWQFSVNGKYFFGTHPWRPFVNGGAGIYGFDPGDTEFGLNAGAGLLYEVSAKWGVEGVWNYHATDPLDWWTAQIGVRWHF